MKRLFILAAAAMLGAAACGDNPNEPSGGTVTPTTFTIPLSPANEVPPIESVEAASTGTATIVIRITRDSNGSATAATADFQFNVGGFPGDSTITMAHIHPGAAGSIGGILVDTGLSAGQLGLSGGGGSITRNGINVPADTAVAIVNNAAGYYFNVHSTRHASGVLRGQLQGGGAVVDPGDPEPIPY